MSSPRLYSSNFHYALAIAIKIDGVNLAIQVKAGLKLPVESSISVEKYSAEHNFNLDIITLEKIQEITDLMLDDALSFKKRERRACTASILDPTGNNTIYDVKYDPAYMITEKFNNFLKDNFSSFKKQSKSMGCTLQ